MCIEFQEEHDLTEHFPKQTNVTYLTMFSACYFPIKLMENAQCSSSILILGKKYPKTYGKEQLACQDGQL